MIELQNAGKSGNIIANVGVKLAAGASQPKLQSAFNAIQATLENSANVNGHIAIELGEIEIVAGYTAVHARSKLYSDYYAHADINGNEVAAEASESTSEEPVIHIQSSATITAGWASTSRPLLNNDGEGELTEEELTIFDAVSSDEDDARERLEAALKDLPDTFSEQYKQTARDILAARTYEAQNPKAPAFLAAEKALGIGGNGILASTFDYLSMASHITGGDGDPEVTDREREIIESFFGDTDSEFRAALKALPETYPAAWKNQLLKYRSSFSTRDIKIDVADGSITSDGDAIVVLRPAWGRGNSGVTEVTIGENAEIHAIRNPIDRNFPVHDQCCGRNCRRQERDRGREQDYRDAWGTS